MLAGMLADLLAPSFAAVCASHPSAAHALTQLTGIGPQLICHRIGQPGAARVIAPAIVSRASLCVTLGAPTDAINPPRPTITPSPHNHLH